MVRFLDPNLTCLSGDPRAQGSAFAGHRKDCTGCHCSRTSIEGKAKELLFIFLIAQA